MPATYPKRPPFYSHRFMRVLFKSCAALEIGQGAVCLLAAVVNIEDAKRYSGEVFFFNDHLRSLTGFRSDDALATARKRAIEAGWLHYEPGGKHVAGRYWVTIPARLEVLDDTPLGENGAAMVDRDQPPSADGSVVETRSNRSSAGRERTDSGSTAEAENVNPLQRGSRADGQRFDSGSTAEHSTLSLSLTLSQENATPTTASEPRLDPNEQDITSQADVPREADPRGTKNDRVPAPIPFGQPGREPTAAELSGLGVWIRWRRASDPSRQDENLATLRHLALTHGLIAVQRAAERLQLAGNPERDRAPGDKCWVDEILPEILRASGVTMSLTPAVLTTVDPQSEIVARAHALVREKGAAACRDALGWKQTIAPTEIELLAALEREPVATELVDAFAHGPFVVVPE